MHVHLTADSLGCCAATFYCPDMILAKETVLEGKFQDGVLPEAFCGLFSGSNTGKMIVRITEE